MNKINQAISTLAEIRERLEQLKNRTDDRQQSTHNILRELADFREEGLNELIGDLEWIEEQLDDYVQENE